jgi:hypothetical protein
LSQITGIQCSNVRNKITDSEPCKCLRSQLYEIELKKATSNARYEAGKWKLNGVLRLELRDATYKLVKDVGHETSNVDGVMMVKLTNF